MTASAAEDIRVALAAICERLQAQIDLDADAIVDGPAEVAANTLIGRAVAIVTGDAAIAALTTRHTVVSPTDRPAVLARDLLISATLAARALSRG